MTDQEIILKREVARLQEQVRLLMLQKQQLELKVEKMKCCANCKNCVVNKHNVYACSYPCGFCEGYANWELAE